MTIKRLKGKNSYYGDLAIVYEYVNAKEDSFVKTSTDFYVYNFSKLIIDKDGIVTLEAPSELDEDKMVKLSAQSDHFIVIVSMMSMQV